MTAMPIAGNAVENEPLASGVPAPGFALASTPEQQISLSMLRGRPVILAFYPADWSPVCSDQMPLYSELMPEFNKYNAQILGISVDSAWCHNAFARERHIRFPLLADFEPKGQVSRLYNSYRTDDGFSERALYVIDGEGIVRWSHISPIQLNPGADGILAALDDLAKAKVSP